MSISQASIALTPNAYKANKIYCIKPTNGDADLTFTRASLATRVDETGLIETMATGVPRLDYTGGGCPSLLVEPQRTNLVTYSNDYSNASWLKPVSVTVTNNSIISPEGIQNASTFASTSSSYLVKSISATAQYYTSSVFFKKGTHSSFLLVFENDAATFGSRVTVNTSTLDLTIVNNGATTGTTAKIEDYGNGWYRVSLNVLGTINSYFSGISTTSSGSTYFYGFQLEAGSNATSYIPTVASTVTRNADVISKTGISSLIGQTEGTIFMELNLSLIAEVRNALVISDGSTSNRIQLRTTLTNQIELIFVIFGNTQAQILSSINQQENLKIAFAYKQNDVVLYINGILIGTDTSVSIPSTSVLHLGHGYGSSQINDRINSIQIFKERLTNAELETLTSYTSFEEMALALDYTIEITL